MYTNTWWYLWFISNDVLIRRLTVSVSNSFQYDDGCESCGTDTFNREPFVVMFSSDTGGGPSSLSKCYQWYIWNTLFSKSFSSKEMYGTLNSDSSSEVKKMKMKGMW